MESEHKAVLIGLGFLLAMILAIIAGITIYQVDNLHKEKSEYTYCISHNMKYYNGNCIK